MTDHFTTDHLSTDHLSTDHLGTEHHSTHSPDNHHDAIHESHEEHSAVAAFIWFLAVCLLCSIVIKILMNGCKKYIEIPYTTVLLFFGLILATVEQAGLLHNHFGNAIDSVEHIDPHALLVAFIPALIFESAFSSNYHVMTKQLRSTLLLSGPGVVINAFITAVIVKYLLPYNWDWSQSILFGSIVSATDPVAVVAILKELGASDKLSLLIEGESLLNDGSAFVLYVICLEFVKGNSPTTGEVVGQFFQLAFGGAAFGSLCGIIFGYFLSFFYNKPEIEITTTIMACYLVFYVGELWNFSGVLCVVFLGLLLSKNKTNITAHVLHSLHHVWHILSFIANSLVFIFAGIIIVTAVEPDKDIHVKDFDYAILTYVILHITRFLTILILWFPMTYKIKKGYEISIKDGFVLWFGGLRGVIGMALALITKLQKFNDYKFGDEVMFQTCAVVVLTLIINAPLMKPIVKYLGLTKMSKDAESILFDAIHEISHKTKKHIVALKYNYSGADWDTVYKLLPDYTYLLKNTSKEDNIDLKHMSRRSTFNLNTLANDNKNGVEKENNLCDCWYQCYFCCKCYQCCETENSDDDIYKKSAKEHELAVMNSDKLGNELQVPTSANASTMSALSEDGTYNTSTSALKGGEISNGNHINHHHNNSHHMSDRSETLQLDVESIYNHRTSRAVPRTNIDIHSKSFIIEVKVRLLHVLKALFYERFEEGLISNDAAMMLEEFIDTALDKNDIARLGNNILKIFQVNLRWEKWYESNSCCLRFIGRTIVVKQLQLAFECGEEFVHAVPEAKEILEKEIDSIKLLTIFDDIKRQCVKIQNELNHIQNAFPDIYRAIETRHVLRVLINTELESIQHLKGIGLLTDGECHKMTDKLTEVHHKLHQTMGSSNNSIIKIQERNRQNEFYTQHVLTHLPIWNKIKHNLSEKKALLLAGAQLFNVKKNEYLFKFGQKPKGILVIVDGTAIIRNRMFSTYKWKRQNVDHNNDDEKESKNDNDNNNNNNDNDDEKKTESETEKNTEINGKKTEIDPPYLKKKDSFKIDIANRSQRINDIEIESTFITGSTFCWEYLYKINYTNDCKALSDVKYYLIDDNTISQVFKNEKQAEYGLWKLAASNIIRSRFLHEFEGISRDKIAYITDTAQLKNIRKKGKKINIGLKTLLLSGSCMCLDNIGKMKNKIFDAPNILPTNHRYEFEQNSRILIFDSSKIHHAGTVKELDEAFLE